MKKKNSFLIMKRFLKPFDYIFVLRPTLFFPVWTVFLAGFFVQQKFSVAAINTTTNDVSTTYQDRDFLIVGLFLTLLMGAVFILNQIRDRFTDHQNQKLFLIANGYLTPKAAFIEALILIAAAVICAFLFSNIMGFLFLIILIVTGIFYSFEPFSWKDKPILGLFTNILGAVLIFGGGWIIDGSVSQKLLLHALPYACAVAAVYLFTTLPDLQGDASSEKVTFGVKYGFKATVYLGLFFEILALFSSFRLNDEIIFYPAFFSLPFFVWAVVKLKINDVIRVIKYSILFLSLTICIKFHFYFFILVGVYLISKIYYKLRFGIDYPNLSV
ncbi:MAG: UbiA family prenyltransferase [bacterium]